MTRFRMRNLPALALAIGALASPSRAVALTADSSCAAAWLPESQKALHWAHLSASEAVLVVGSEIVARLALAGQGIEIRSRERPLRKLRGTAVLQDEDRSVLRVEAKLPVDSTCSLSIHGPASYVSQLRLIDQASARALIGQARDADAAEEAGRAAQLASTAFDRLTGFTIPELPQKLDIAAYAIERQLEAGHSDQAANMLALSATAALSDLPPGHPSRLRFELAQARALAFSDKNEESLNLRLALQPRVVSTFGPFSDESFFNQLRVTVLRQELGKDSQTRFDLEALRKSVSRHRLRGDRLRVLTTQALANALALEGLAKESVGLLVELRDELVVSHGQRASRVIDIDEQIARMQYRLNQLESALQGASKVFLWRREHLPLSDVRTLESCWMVALLYKEFGRYDSARALITTLLDESKHAAEPLPRQLVLKTLATLGSIEAAEGNVDSAEQILRTAWQGYAEIVGEKSIDTIGALMNYALLLVQNGRVDGICPILREKFAAGWTALRTDVQMKALSKMLLGLCLLTDTAPRQTNREGLAELESAWIDLKTQPSASSYSAMYALSTLAWANFQFGDREAAKLQLRALVAQAERSRSATPRGSYTRDFWFSKWIVERSQNLGYRTLALLHAQDGELDEALRISELARDRRLRDRFAAGGWLSEKLPRDGLERLRKLTTTVQILDEKLALENRVIERVNLESQRILAVAARDDFERKAARRYKINPPETESPSGARLRVVLPARTAIASIQRTADVWWAIVIQRNLPTRFIVLDGDPDLALAARAWIRLLNGIASRAWPMPDQRLVLDYERPADATGRFLSRDELGQRLGRAILGPLASAAPQASRFVIIADDELNSVPFAAMRTEGALAVDQFEVAYAPSLGTYATLRHPMNKPTWSRDLLSIAVDEIGQFGAGAKAGVGSDARDDSVRSVVTFASRHPLPFAAKEVEALSGNFPASRVAVFRGLQASKETMLKASRDGSLQSYHYVHLAAHAFAFPDNPERSVLVLNAPNTAAAAERVLTAAELSNLRMGSELIVLSACGTAVGRYERGQGLLGFAFAALAAGNEAAVLSLWEVADDLTMRFMARFYEQLRRGMRPSEALAATQREFAHDPDPRISNPSSWAAFVLYGGS